MYLDYFGLDKDPFSISPDPSFLYPSPLHRQALAHLKYGIDREGGFILLSGEVGTGKTTLTRLLLQQLAGNIRVAYVLNARLGEEDLLSSICQELKIDVDTEKASLKQYTDLLNKDLLAAHAAGKKTLVVIEEAQNLSPEVLEMLRLLTNLETNTTKLLHILLVAQPEILETIGRPELRQLNQRIISRYQLQPLSRAETYNYVQHRMQRAGCARPVFDRPSISELHQLSGGIPRIINLIAERSLVGAYASSQPGVTKKVVRTAAGEVLGEAEKAPGKSSGGYWGWGVLGAVIVVAFTLWFYSQVMLAPVPLESDILEDQDVADAGDLGSLGPADVQSVPIDTTSDIDSDLVSESSAAHVSSSITKNAYTRLLALWLIDEEVTREDQLCSVAEQNNLRCALNEQLTIEELQTRLRPGLIRLQEGGDRVAIYLLSRIEAGQAFLENAENEVGLPLEQFSDQWDGDFLFIWKPPLGYEAVLYVGDKNPQVVDWLQQRLQSRDSDYEPLISGGIYSIAISEHVRRFQLEAGLEPDGLLGPATISALNDLDDQLPQLVTQ